MAENSKIEWTHHTFNPWWGCTRVSPGCAHCYAETLSHRYGNDLWGKGKPRRPASEKVWAEPVKWNKAAIKAGERHRVFCSSMADVFDSEAPEGARSRLWALINQTPQLDWLILTKRPENMASMLPHDWGKGWANVWLGVSAENQDLLHKRATILRDTPAAIRFISAEPLLSELDFECGGWSYLRKLVSPQGCVREPIHWVIVGGESGPGARPMDLNWARQIRDNCLISGAAFFFKQIGGARDKGGDLESIPEDLRIREFPKGEA
jgi:protein gp37